MDSLNLVESFAEFAKQTAVESVTLSKQTPREPLPFEKFLSQRNKI